MKSRIEGKSTRVLITGGAGFIGSHLCDRFIELGCSVTCLDNFYTGSRDNIEGLLAHPHFTLVEHDIVDPYDIECDLIMNFACPASPVHYQTDPIKTTLTSFLGTLNMLRLAQKNGARLVQASTSEVYGDPLVHPQPETYWGNVNPIGPRSCYDEGKRCAETLCFDFWREHGVDIRVVRIFNTYGPRMAVNDGRVVSNFIVQALRGENLTVFGDGKQTRSFCYVDDLLDAILRFTYLEGDEVGPINCGNDGEFTMLELAQAVLGKIDSQSKMVTLALPEDDPKCRRPDLSKTSALLDWKPSIPLKDGLEKTINYFRDKLREA